MTADDINACIGYGVAIMALLGVGCVLLLIWSVMCSAGPVREHKPRYKGYDPRDYKTAEWRALRDYVIQREDGRCQYCGGTAQTAHHLTYKKGVICPPGLLQSICWSCHNKIHDKHSYSDELLEGQLTDWEIEQLIARGEAQLNRRHRNQ